MKWFPVLLLFLLGHGAVLANTILLPLTPEQGLSQGAVRNLHLDSHGFLWIATAGGINRFDGNKISELHAKNHRLSEIAFSEILEDSSGRLWLSADHTGLYLYDPQDSKFELFISAPREADSPIDATILALIEYDKDHLLFVVNKAIYQLKIADKSVTKIFDLKDIGYATGWIRKLLLHQDKLYIAAFNGVILLDLASGQHHYLPHLPTHITQPRYEQRHTKSLYLSREHLYVGTVSGLYQLSLADIQHFIRDNTPYQPEEILAERNIWSLKSQQEKLLIATDVGLYSMAFELNAIELPLSIQESNQPISDPTVLDMVADPNGGIWLASRTEGAYYWHPQSEAFAHWSSSTGYPFSSDNINRLWLHEQSLWLATANGLNQFTEQSTTAAQFLVHPDPKLSWREGNILHITPGNGVLWLTTATGIKGFDLSSKQLFNPILADEKQRALFNSTAVGLLYQDDYFIFKQQQKLYRYAPKTGQIDELSTLNTRLPMMYFGTVLGILDDNSWLLSTSDQLWQYYPDTDTLTLRYQYPNYQPQLNRYATSMQKDTQGLLWIGFKGIGLLGFNANSWQLNQLFSVDNKLRSNEVFSLQTDNVGDIWFSSRQGLARLQPTTLQIEYFDKTDGLAFHEFKDKAAVKLDDGRLVFGGLHGVIVVEPTKLRVAETPLNMVITDFSVLSGQQQTVQGFLNNREFTLSYKDAGLKIHFSAMNFHRNRKLQYRYWLTGTQHNNYPEQQDSQVVFPQLSPGTYQFHVQAISPLTGEQSQAATLQLSILPPWWRSTTAYWLYFISVAAITLLFWRKRRQQQSLLQQAHQQVMASEQRLTQALESVNSGVFEWQAATNSMASSRLPRMLGTSELMHTITLSQHCSLIHPDDVNEFQRQWQHLLQQSNQRFDVTYRMRHQNGQWLWFRDQGRVIHTDEHKQAATVLGTYTNITETKANEEKARLFGEAFQQTRDWVVILDLKQRVIAANHSFSQAFGGIEPYIDSPKVHHLGISLVRRRFYTQLLNSLQHGEHWQAEELVITPDGRERPTLINVSAVGEHDVAFFVLVFTDITEQKAAEEELRYLANYDALTGLPNRALLMDRIQHGIEQARQQQRSLALCFIDLDKFKHVNDSLGHDIGDLMLKEVAQRLKRALRESDTVARLGGDEFVVLLEGYKQQENISHVANKMLTIISEPMQLGEDNVSVSPSIGIAVFPDDAANGTELMKHADVAMYHAKEAGRNNFQFFIQEMNDKAHKQLARETQLRKAMQRQEFVNYYQPIIDSSQQSIVGVEVLLRWQSLTGLISPAEFIPLAEELRLIVPMTQQLLTRALADMAQWRLNGYNLYLSVNLSTQHLEQTTLAHMVQQLLHSYNLPADCLRFEITESALMRDQQDAINTMQALSDLGIKLALDDFGTGYSSLKYLKELPLDAIKIDRSFVQDIGIDHNDETIIEAMLGMANNLGLYCVAEGVETEQQLAFFNNRGCHLIQGFLFSRPLTAAQLASLLTADTFVVNRID